MFTWFLYLTTMSYFNYKFINEYKGKKIFYRVLKKKKKKASSDKCFEV